MDYICLLVYVDDVFISSPNESLILEVKEVLHKAFTIKDMGHARYFLGMEIARGNSGIALNQREYILYLISSVGLLNCHSASTPLPHGLRLNSLKRVC